MSSGRPDYFGRMSNVTAVLGTDQEPWSVYKFKTIDANSSAYVYSYTIPEGQKLSILYIGVSCYEPGINLFSVRVDGVEILEGWFDTCRDIILGGDTGYLVKAGEYLQVFFINYQSHESSFILDLVGFIQYI